MIDNFADNRGTITQNGNLMQVQNAFVEEVSASGNTGFILISYATPRQNGVTTIDLLRLNVNRNTVITNRAGLPINLRDIRQGSWIDAAFSPIMTRSIPPQSNAFLIVLRQQPRPQPQPQPPVQPSVVTTGTVIRVDPRGNILYAGNPRNINQQTRYIITDRTEIVDCNGRPIRLRALRPGDRVRITHSMAQTASIPPQTTAFRIQQL